MREQAEEEWEALPPARQFEAMREGLRGGDKEARRVAAFALDPLCLTLEEIRLQMAVLAERPDDLVDRANEPRPFPVGSPDLPAIWRASLRVEPSDRLVMALSDFHRASLPSHIPALVSLLPEAGPDLFPILRWQLALLADETDEHRADVVRAMLYVLARLRADGPPPRPLPVPREDREAFLVLAEATWGLAPDGGFGQERIDAAQVSAGAPRCWLHRWAKEAPLTEADQPFVARVAAEANQLLARAWAARRLGDEVALREIAAGDDEVAFLAAAELARRGDRTELDGIGEMFLWHADRELARQDWVRRFREEQQQAKEDVERGEMPWTQTGLFPEDPIATEAEWGIRIAPEDIAWIGEQLVALGAPAELLAWYYADANPDALTAEAARRVLAELRPPDPVVLSWPVEEFLGLCEVRDRAAVVELLNRWALSDAGRDHALALLAMLGETAHAAEMIEAWDGWGFEQWFLGRVRDPRVEKFLRERALAPDPEGALDALSTFHGLADPGFSDRDEFVEADWSREPFAGARTLLVEGKAVDAVLHLAARDELKEWAAATLAGSRDPRVLAFLRRMREEQWRGVYWVATAALATSGDAAALQEWRAFVGDDRTWLFDVLARWGRRWSILTAGGDEALVRHWVSRINTNCCLKFHAYSTLSQLYPTIPLGNEGPGDWGQKGKTVRAWFDRHAFRRSEILGGFVPGE